MAKDLRRGRYDHERYLKNREVILAKSKEYYQNNKDTVRKRSRRIHLKKKYNLDQDQYLAMCVAQGNLCAICKAPETRRTPSGDIQPLCVDHNHFTNQVRELLCNDCNALLGFCKENLEILENAILYLEENQ